MNKSYRSHKGHRGPRRGWRSLALPLALVCAVALLAGWLLDMNGWGALQARATEGLEGVRISEVQNHNALTLPNADGSGPAWIELENAGDAPVSLKGLCLTRDTKLNKTLVFPDIRMEPGAFLLVYADGKGIAAADGALHAPFRLPKSGAHTLYLYDSTQKLLDEVAVPAMQADESLCRDAGGRAAAAVAIADIVSRREARCLGAAQAAVGAKYGRAPQRGQERPVPLVHRAEDQGCFFSQLLYSFAFS